MSKFTKLRIVGSVLNQFTTLIPTTASVRGDSSSPTLHAGIEVPLAEVLPFVFTVGSLLIS